MSVSPERFRKALELKQRELVVSASKREEICIENSPEEFERLQEHMNRELAIRNLDRDSILLKSVSQAIGRLDSGAFGVCLHCEEEIPEKRLNAVPWAALCLDCQEKFDRRKEMAKLEGGLFLSAA